MTRNELLKILQSETDSFNIQSRLRDDVLDAMEQAYLKGKNEQCNIADVGGSYRMLKDGEVIKKGDEFRDANFNWKKSNSCGKVFTHEDYYPHRRLAYR